MTTLNTPDAARLCGYTVGTFRVTMTRLAAAGQSFALYPGVRGRAQSWDRDRLEAWIAAGKPMPRVDAPAVDLPGPLRARVDRLRDMERRARQAKSDADQERSDLIGALLALPLTHAQIAGVLGLSRAQVSKLVRSGA